ncbi:MAG: glycosyltransferase family 39 protein [Candidatus Eisenbacteria bacterium]
MRLDDMTRVGCGAGGQCRAHSIEAADAVSELRVLSAPNSAATRRTNFVCCVLLALTWLVIVSLTGPLGDFPLNDDWSYGLAVRSLVETGSLQFTGWVSMPLVAQVAWGYLFCLPSGFSFTALRLSTLTLGLVGVLFSYALLREARAAASIAFLGALVVAVNPLYVLLSHTFMTDVPFFSFAVASIFFLARGLRSRSRRDHAVGLALAVVATLVRQVGIVIPVAFAGAYLVRAKGDALRWRSILRAALPTLTVFGILVLYRIWLTAHVGLPALYDARSKALAFALVARSLPKLVASAAWGVYIASVYLGLFLLPFSVVVILQRGRDCSGHRARFLILALGLAVAGVALAVFRGEFMPLAGNILYNLGLGPPTLRDVYILKLNHLPSVPGVVWVTLTVLAIMSVAALMSHVVLRRNAASRCRGSLHDAQRHWFSVFALVAGVVYLVPVAVAGFFDRYLIFLVPLVLAAVSRTTHVRGTRPGALCVSVGVTVALVFGAFSVAGTHDYLSWNRARWEAIDHLTENVGIDPSEMDGGFEFNGYYLYDEDYEPRPDASWWWVYGDTYVLAFGAMDGYDVAGSYSFRRWLPVGEGRVLILRKAIGISPRPIDTSNSEPAGPGVKGNSAGISRREEGAHPGLGRG